MTIFIILITLLIISALVNALKDGYNEFCEMLVGILSLILVILFISVPMSRYKDKKFIRDYQVTKTTIQTYRKNRTNINNSIEGATILKNIIKINTYITNATYWNDTIWDIWTVDDVTQLEQLK